MLEFLREPHSIAEMADHRFVYRPHVEIPIVAAVERRSADLHVHAEASDDSGMSNRARLAGYLAALTFLCLATFPIVGGVINSFEGFGLGLLLCSGVGILVAPLLFTLGVWVAAKI